MKANAPEKVYIEPNLDSIWGMSERSCESEIEFTRTDAFIEKAVKWIEKINNHHHIMRYSDSCEPPLSELTEWFKNYMKGE